MTLMTYYLSDDLEINVHVMQDGRLTLSIDDILTGATMVDDKRKKLQTCYHFYLAAIGSGDWDLVAKYRDEMDEVLSQSGWEWIDDRA